MKSIILFISISLSLFYSCKNDTNFDFPKDNSDNLAGPISRPKEGYGMDGAFTLDSITFDSPRYSGRKVVVFFPKEAESPRPVIFYCHPYSGEQSSYQLGLYRFIAQKGYVVVFAPYPTLGVSVDERYNTLWESFEKAVTLFPEIIDTTKVGFMGHSFGGGACFGLAHKGFVEKNWGTKGRFIFAMAQWYSFQLSEEQLKSFPENTKLITQVYEDDATNDHRMAIDIFKNINIPDSEKDYILVKSSYLPSYVYNADHGVPNTNTTFDAYDYYCIYRLLDALMDYSFNGNEAAKNVALGNGSAEQITMPSYNGIALRPLQVSDQPLPSQPQKNYVFECNNPTYNQRIIFCE